MVVRGFESHGVSPVDCQPDLPLRAGHRSAWESIIVAHNTWEQKHDAPTGLAKSAAMAVASTDARTVVRTKPLTIEETRRASVAALSNADLETLKLELHTSCAKAHAMLAKWDALIELADDPDIRAGLSGKVAECYANLADAYAYLAIATRG